MKKVLCVVVTYNRLECLKECISGLKSQTCQDFDTLVVNNGSTDGTNKFLNQLDNVIVITQENLGSSGGQYAGMKYGFEKGYEWVWMMDDDGIPDKSCLENMLRYQKEYAFISPIVLNKDNPSEMSFGTLKVHDYNNIKETYPRGVIVGHANPFNGVLFRRDLVKEIGFPMKDMFIWGDENEYEARAVASGYIPVTVINAIHYHPKDRLVLYPDFLGKNCIVYVESKLKRYCKYRNFAYVLKTYKSWYNVALFIFRYSFYFVISRKFDVRGLLFFYGAVIDGINNNFTKHNKYL